MGNEMTKKRLAGHLDFCKLKRMCPRSQAGQNNDGGNKKKQKKRKKKKNERKMKK